MPQRGTVVHEEVTFWPLWVRVLVWGACLTGAAVSFRALGDPVAGGSLYGAVIGVLTVLLAPVGLHAFFGRLRVRVTRTSLHMTIGYTPFIVKVVEFGDIVAMEAVRYSPIREFGGWGIRRSFRGKKRAWTMRGNQALVLTLPDSARLYVGSDDPKRLAARIRLVADIPDASVRNDE